MSHPDIQLYATPANLYFLKGRRLDPPETGEVYLYLEIQVPKTDQHIAVERACHGQLTVKFPGYYVSCKKVHGYPYQVHKEKLILGFEQMMTGERHEIFIKFDLRKPSDNTPIDEDLNFEIFFEYDDPLNSMTKVQQKQKLTIKGTYNAELHQMGLRHAIMQKFDSHDSGETYEENFSRSA